MMRFLLCILMVACGGRDVETASPNDDTSDMSDTSALTLNDVSVLFPAVPGLWPATMPARGGPLLSEVSVADIKLSLVRELPEVDEYAALRVVAVRFDPCFQRVIDGACQPQVRLVLQVPDPAGGFFDGAVHALYAVPFDELPGLVSGLRALAAKAPENAAATQLGVSPALSAQGLDGPYGQGLKALVARYAGAGSLVRVTFMTRTLSRSGQWQFGGFEPPSTPSAAGTKLAIAGLTPRATQQNVTRNFVSGSHAHHYAVMPPFAEAVGRPGASGSSLQAGASGDVHAWALRQEDPRQHLPDTTDCASCHLSGRVAQHLETLDPSLLTAELVAQRVPRTTNVGELDHDNLRAFGWFGTYPVVAQRTANETGAVLRAFAKLR